MRFEDISLARDIISSDEISLISEAQLTNFVDGIKSQDSDLKLTLSSAQNISEKVRLSKMRLLFFRAWTGLEEVQTQISRQQPSSQTDINTFYLYFQNVSLLK